MTLRHMKIFVAVCDCGSVTAAARNLGLAQPAVSLAIKELETYYGIKLFDRISRKLFVTEKGKTFLQYARQIVSLFDEMENGVKDWDSFGMLRVGSSVTIGTCLLSQFIARFSPQYPNVKVRVTIDNSSVIEDKILLSQLDFALIEGQIHSENIISKSFMEDELVLVCGAHHPLAAAQEISLEELLGQTLILREKGSGTRELFDSTLLTHGLTAAPAWESISTEAIIGAVSCGMGVSVLPYKLVRRELEERRLVRIFIPHIKFQRSFTVIRHKDKHLSKSAQAFIRLVTG
ncbi:LysR family transcriptional regulator [Caproicibacter sp.]|uniref:LysR family transcriptional regulator n=1 Tax=Caproicibacter sp. TaxID=2814884 RepID=UPI003988B63A